VATGTLMLADKACDSNTIRDLIENLAQRPTFPPTLSADRKGASRAGSTKAATPSRACSAASRTIAASHPLRRVRYQLLRCDLSGCRRHQVVGTIPEQTYVSQNETNSLKCPKPSVLERVLNVMSLYSLLLLDTSDRVIDERRLEAPDGWQALTQANHRLWRMFRQAGPSASHAAARVDVVDEQGTTIARIHCPEAVAAMF
jgi:hypothetical protein